jgi:hypothetical protein
LRDEPWKDGNETQRVATNAVYRRSTRIQALRHDREARRAKRPL